MSFVCLILLPVVYISCETSSKTINSNMLQALASKTRVSVSLCVGYLSVSVRIRVFAGPIFAYSLSPWLNSSMNSLPFSSSLCVCPSFPLLKPPPSVRPSVRPSVPSSPTPNLPLYHPYHLYHMHTHERARASKHTDAMPRVAVHTPLALTLISLSLSVSVCLSHSLSFFLSHSLPLIFSSSGIQLEMNSILVLGRVL